MGKFSYRMQNILDLKLKFEEQAKQEFVAKKNLLDQEEEKKMILIERKAEYESKAKELLTGTLDVFEISVVKEAIMRMEEFIVIQEEQIQFAKKKLEKARIALEEVMKERKVQEILKENAFEEFLQEEKRLDHKEIDELTSYTYGRKAQLVGNNGMEEGGSHGKTE